MLCRRGWRGWGRLLLLGQGYKSSRYADSPPVYSRVCNPDARNQRIEITDQPSVVSSFLSLDSLPTVQVPVTVVNMMMSGELPDWCRMCVPCSLSSLLSGFRVDCTYVMYIHS